MDIAFIVGNFPKVSETFILNQVTGLINAGHDVDIISLKRPDESQKHEDVNSYNLMEKTTYVSSTDTYFRALSSLLTTPLDLWFTQSVPMSDLVSTLTTGTRAVKHYEMTKSVLEAGDYDVYHAHFGPMGDFSRLTFEHTDTPAVVSFYGQDVSRALEKEPRRYTPMFRSVDAVTALSNEMCKNLQKLGCAREKIWKQQLAIDLSTFDFCERHEPEEGPIELLTVARLVEKKGISFVINAVSDLYDDFDIRYRIVGDGPLRQEIEKKIGDKGLNDTVQLLGWQKYDRVVELMRESHIFVLTSVTSHDNDKEGTPTVLLEAQASSLPVVSTYHAGIPEIVKDKESGLLVPERDIDALVSALHELLSNSERWEKMGKQGREFVKDTHSIPAMVDRLETIYNAIGDGTYTLLSLQGLSKIHRQMAWSRAI